MNEQSPKRDRFYWFIAAFTATQIPISALILLDFVLHPLAPDFNNQSTLFRLFSGLVIVPLVVFIAILVIRRAPHNVTGLFLLLWVTTIIGTTIREDAGVQVLQILSIGWVGVWFLFLYFPDGRVFPRRFERYIRLLCVGLVLSVVAWSLSAPSNSTSQLPNPIFIPALEGLFPAISAIEQILLLAIVVIIIPSLIARYRGSDQRVRQQLKWLVWVFFGILLSIIPVVILGLQTRRAINPVEQFLFSAWSTFSTLAPFFAVAIAILRHKLYDIDIIIRRTLIYSVLTTILAVIYFGGVILTQQIFKAITGQTSDLAIVVSTLLIAALFSPLRRRVQDVIDSRLYRRKYDAEKTLAQFQQNLRDEVDMETLKANLVSVVSDTMQPRSIGLWINTKDRKEINS